MRRFRDIEHTLIPCPYCGEDKRLSLDRKSKLVGHNGLDMRVELHTFSVRCNVCHARGGTAGGKVMNEHRLRPDLPLPEWATTDEALIEKAVAAWNRRSEGYQITFTPCSVRKPPQSGNYLVHHATASDAYGVIHYSKRHDAFNAFDQDRDPKYVIEVDAWAELPKEMWWK
ncbi:MAG: hypothetical protein J6Q14_03730 [Oscillospiraceae bacterium]|nr:hypothetical protein [Oscillospiraceae bacterium]